MQLDLHPVAVVKCTFTHKQYMEQHNRHKQYIEQHNSLIRKSADRAPSLWGIRWHLPYNWGKIKENTSANVRYCGEYSLPCRPVSISNMVAMVTTLMEPIVSIITSYHGYSDSCISVLAVVSGSIDALNLQWNLSALLADENR